MGRARVSSNGQALVRNGPDEDGVVKNGVIKYSDGRTPFTGVYGVKRPDGSIEIRVLKGLSYGDGPEVSDEMRDEIYDKLLDYEGPAPMEYNGSYQVQEPLRYDHVNKGGPENNDGDATFGERKGMFTRIKEFLAGENKDEEV